uniref:RNA polymerase subunit beta'' n=1 Tax=Prototheca lentecrescens TaxID=2836214 RepID=UPI0030013AFC
MIIMKLQTIELINSIYKKEKKEIDFPFLNTPLNKKGLQFLIKWFLIHYGEKPTLDFLDKLKKFGFSEANKAGISLGLDDLIVPINKEGLIIKTNLFAQKVDFDIISGNITSIEKAQRTINLWNTTSELLKEEVVTNFRKKKPLNPLAMMAFSGARGNISQVRQLIGMRGLMADPQGIIVEVPIKSNFKEGITLTEYLISCFGARKGLVDTALRTATSGYLTRRLVDAVEHIKISTIDCETTNGITIKGIYNQKSLIGRVLLKAPQQFKLYDKKIFSYFPFFSKKEYSFFEKKKENVLTKNQIISYTLATTLYENSTEISIRSPLTCQKYKTICQFCYGWDLARGNLIHIGEAVGIIAAQSIGEPGTQLTMRTFHTGGVGVFSEKLLKKHKAPFNGVIHFPERLPGLMVRTPQGDIGFIIKYSPLKPTRTLLEIKTEKQQNYFFNLQESQLPPGTLLMVQEGQNVKKGDIIAQISQALKKKSIFPEIVYPVQSKIEGESFFESVNVTKLQQISTLNLSSINYRKESSLFDQIERKFQKFLAFYIKAEKGDLEPFEDLNPSSFFINKTSSFWVLFSQIQKELKKSNSFLRIGDSISSQTPLYKINYYFPSVAQMKQISSKLTGVIYSFDFSILNIRLHKTFYSLTTYRKRKSFLFWNFSQFPKKRIQFFWYTENWRLFHFSFLIFSKKRSALTKLKMYNSLLLEKNLFFGDLYILSFCFFSCKLPFFFFSLKSNESKKKKLNPIFFTYNYSILFKKIELFFLFNTKNLVLEEMKSLNNTWNIEKNQFIEFSYSLKHQLVPQNFFIFNQIRKEKRIKPKLPKKLMAFQQTWVVILKLKKKKLPFRYSSFFNLSMKKFILLKNNFCSELSMENQTLSLDYFYSTQFYYLKLKTYLKLKKTSQYFFYDKKNIISSQFVFKNDFFFIINKKNGIKTIIYKKINKNLFFYKLNKKKRLKTLASIHKKFSIKQKKFIFLTFQQNNQKSYSLSSYLNIETLWASSPLKKKNESFLIKTKSPLFTKQTASFVLNLKNRNPFLLFNNQVLFKEGWFFSKNLMQTQLNFYCNLLEQRELIFSGFIPYMLQNIKNNNNLQAIKTFRVQKFQLLFSIKIEKKHFDLNIKSNKLQLFPNAWTIPTTNFASGFNFSNLLGDFIQLKKLKKNTYWSNLCKKNIITLNLPSLDYQLNLKIGSLFRYNQKITNDFLVQLSGRIIKINNNQITFRRGLPFLASKKNTIFLSHKDIVMKNQVLFTLKSTKLETQDIVQGIPKIERLFEARELPMDDGSLTVQNKLETFFINALDNFNFYNTNEEEFIITKSPEKSKRNQMIHAFKIANDQIQQFLVENIIEAYRNQNVFIGEKHVEIVVREMTTRVRILNSGSTGFLPGEILQLKIVETINNKMISMKKIPAIYDPIVLGITKSVLYSESFLLAASFQEVTRVLTRSASTKKTDFLLGLHENVILGQFISAGSGFFTKT